MYFVTCDDDKNRKRKLNSLVCTLNDTCVKTMHSTESTLAAEKFRNNFPTSVAFFDPQMHSDATYAFRFSMLHDLAKTKILSANKSRDVERYVCRTTALHPRQSPLTQDIAVKFPWDGHLQDISIVSGIPLPLRCSCRRKVFSALWRGRFLSRCPPGKTAFRGSGVSKNDSALCSNELSLRIVVRGAFYRIELFSFSTFAVFNLLLPPREKRHRCCCNLSWKITFDIIRNL